MKEDLSDSSVQSSTEAICLELLGEKLGASLVPEILRLNDETTFQIDGVDREKGILCEVFSHMGALKDGQRKKLARDLVDSSGRRNTSPARSCDGIKEAKTEV